MGKTVNPKTNTKYEGTFPEDFLKHCEKGGSIPEFLLDKRASRTAFDAWCDKYPPMMEAKKMGKVLAEGWWLSQARKFLTSSKNSKRIDTNLYKFIVGGRFGHTSDKDAHERLDKIEEQMSKSAMSQMSISAIAEEAECEPETKE